MFLEALLLTVSAVLKSHGYTRDTMYITIGMNIINVIGNYLCIFGPFGLPVLGVPGVAGVTVVVRFIALTVMSILLFRKVKLPLARDIFRPVKQHVVGLLKIGVPSAGENLSYNISQLVVTSFIAMIGTTALVTRIYSMNVMYYIMLLSIAVGQGTQILVARMIGAGEIHQAYRRGLNSLYIGMISSFVMAIVFNLIGKPLLGLFTDDPSIISLGMKLLMLSLILEPGRAFNIILISSLRAVGDVQFPVYMAILSMWGICVPVSYLLGIHYGMGLIGVFIGFILDEWVRGLCMLWRWRRRGWQNNATIQAARQSASSAADA
jgi:putative MATE family efflux protein